MSKIGIFGGSFNPIHVGHINIALAACDLGLDRMIFVPVARPPHKATKQLPFVDRVAMVRLAVVENPKFEVTEIEGKREGLSYTIDTLKAIKFVNPNSHLHLLIGADTLWEFGTWRDIDGILDIATLIIAKRPSSSFDIQKIQPNKINEQQWAILKKCPILESGWAISSTEIRRAISRGDDLKGLVPEAVAEHLRNFSR